MSRSRSCAGRPTFTCLRRRPVASAPRSATVIRPGRSGGGRAVRGSRPPRRGAGRAAVLGGARVAGAGRVGVRTEPPQKTMGQDHLSDFHGVRCRVKSHSSLGGRNEVRPVDLRGARIPRGAPQGAVRGHARGVQDGSDKSQFLNGARLQPVETATVVRVRDRQSERPMVRSRTPRRCSAASACSTRTSTRRSSWRR